MLRRIQAVKGKYSAQEWQKDAKEQQRLLHQLCEYPVLEKKPQPRLVFFK